MANLFEFEGSYDVINFKQAVPPINDVIIEKQKSIRHFYSKPRHKIIQTKH